jgi:putative ABC transport system permease protein
MFMTIIGVAGCTALLITGFGISDSINFMVNKHFGEIQNYDGSASLDSSNLSASEISRLVKKIQGIEGVGTTIEICDYKDVIEENGTELTAEVQVFKNVEDANIAWNLRDRKTRKPTEMDSEGIIVSEKLAENLKLSVGDTITLESSMGLRREVPVSAITEMYFMHYILMTEDFYRKTYGSDPAVNMVEIIVKEDADMETLKRTVSETDGVVGISFNDSSLESFDSMRKNIDTISYVLIVSSMALAFVVLGNLTNVNISERQREIATLKVLGFRPREVQNYIFKENNILVIAGAILGIPIGMALHRFIMSKIEMEYVMFGRSVDFISIVESVALTIGFGIVINLFMRRKLTDIQMVESLKSVE